MNYNLMRKSFVIVIIITFLFTSFTSSPVMSIKINRNILENTSLEDQGLKSSVNVEYWAILVEVGSVFKQGFFQPWQYTVKGVYKLLFSYRWRIDHIKTLVLPMATRENVFDAFDWINKESNENDVIFFFFSGHGHQIQDRDPLDEEDSKDEEIVTWYSTISDDELNLEFNKFENRRIFAVFDICFAGGMIDGTSDLCSSDRVILTSSNEYETSNSTNYHKGGIFTYYLVEGFKLNDINENKNVSAEEAFEYARQKTIDWTAQNTPSKPQHPQISDYCMGELEIIDLKKKRTEQKLNTVSSFVKIVFGR